MVKVRAYIDANGNKPFTQWFSELDISAAAKERWADYKKRKKEMQ
jgi:hypothetical protein